MIVAIDPKTGLHLRRATEAEAAQYLGKPIRVGEVLIDSYTGPGIWFGGAGF